MRILIDKFNWLIFIFSPDLINCHQRGVPPFGSGNSPNAVFPHISFCYLARATSSRQRLTIYQREILKVTQQKKYTYQETATTTMYAKYINKIINTIGQCIGSRCDVFVALGFFLSVWLSLSVARKIKLMQNSKIQSNFCF